MKFIIKNDDTGDTLKLDEGETLFEAFGFICDEVSHGQHFRYTIAVDGDETNVISVDTTSFTAS